MTAHHVPQTLCMLYLVLSGHVITHAARVYALADAETDQQDENEVKNKVETSHPWCLPWSSQSTKWYHFDVQYREKCEGGGCAAIELVRDSEKPVMNIKGGKQWLVKKDDEGALVWDVYSPGENSPGKNDAGNGKDFTIDILDVEEIRFYPADEDAEKPDTLEIVISSIKGEDGRSQKNEFTIEGGMYYDEKLLQKGFKKVEHEDYATMEKNATDPTHRATGTKVCAWLGGVGSVLTIAGMYTAATIAVQTQALVAVAILGVIGGVVAGAVAGGVIGLVIGVALAMAGYSRVRGHEVKQASRKIFEKLRCLDEMETCSKNVLAPKGKACPRK